jgi:hypothetical protein
LTLLAAPKAFLAEANALTIIAEIMVNFHLKKNAQYSYRTQFDFHNPFFGLIFLFTFCSIKEAVLIC